MILVRSPRQLQSITARLRRRRVSVGFVPTMGYLHDGHLSLMQRARKETRFVIVSIFVNPTQFGPREDYQRYPRDLQRDLKFCRKAKVDLVFAPSVAALYPKGCGTWVEPGRLAAQLCGIHRPGHFRGVATIVTKLFGLVQPARAYVGQKDYQQALIIQRLVKDLDLPVRVILCPTVRDPDGLAMSSRNRYLDPVSRERALSIVKALRWFQREVRRGRQSIPFLKKGLRKILTRGLARLDYVEILGARDLSPPKKLSGRIVLAIAGYVRTGRLGRQIRQVRLIDNCLLRIRPSR